VDTTFDSGAPSFPFGAHLAVVEVDVESGKAVVDRIVTIDDAGPVLNPLLAEGQRHGGIAQGISQALLEEVVYDADGNPLTATFADYAFPSAAEMPSFTLVDMAVSGLPSASYTTSSSSAWEMPCAMPPCRWPSAEMPSFTLVDMATPTPLNPIGAKGIGEAGTIGATPAVQSAVVDAVSHLGVRHIDMPTSPLRIWSAIQAARTDSGARIEAGSEGHA
jgi:aerobic carbon-monoxide dehydrogenase large subunit